MELNLKKKEIQEQPLKVLFQTWRLLPHSYAIVSSFQLIHLYKNYGPEGKIQKNKIEFYVQEMPYFQPHWKSKLVYSEEYNSILKNFREYNGEKVDLIYRLTYPYNITISQENEHTPKCVFYTSEFREFLTQDYFSVNPNFPKTDEFITRFLEQFNKEFYFTSPSDWSSKGLIKYGVPEKRNRIITHGVDSSIFYKHTDDNRRKQVRKMYNVSDDDILLISTGAMTKNKGILLILEVMNILIHRLKRTNYKLLLKGTGDLYQSKQFLEIYFEELIKSGVITSEEIVNLQNYIIFTDKTLSYTAINDLYNSSDLYIAPYLAEGFCLAPLESLSSGLNVLIPRTGSTKEYIEQIFNNGGDSHIFYVNSNVVTLSNGMSQNNITIQDLFKTMISFENTILKERRNENNEVQIKTDEYNQMRTFIQKELSWNNVSSLLLDYFEDIVYKRI
jgi:glycosyltransferase involved in cell wall biosynthesis